MVPTNDILKKSGYMARYDYHVKRLYDVKSFLVVEVGLNELHALGIINRLHSERRKSIYHLSYILVERELQELYQVERYTSYQSFKSNRNYKLKL